MRLVRITFLYGLAVGVAMIIGSAPAQAQADGNAELGKTLFERRSCAGCHSIGKGRRAGPDLGGVTLRRSEEWLTSFLKDTEEMIATDPVAQALYQEHMGVPKMPNINLSDREITALIAYLREEGTRQSS